MYPELFWRLHDGGESLHCKAPDALHYRPDTEIADTIAQALQIEASAERLLKTLPKFDCGNCGAPTCRAFSRDVAEGFADEGDCIFNIIKAMREGRSYEDESDEFVPPPYRKPLR